jgi:hypothetical protein
MSFDAELKLIQAIERVRKLHKPSQVGYETKTVCLACEVNCEPVDYPCRTIKALDSEQE